MDQTRKRGGKKVKGDSRALVPCSLVEEKVFGQRKDPGKVFGRRKNRASRVIPETDDDDESTAVARYHDEESGDEILDEILGRSR